VFFLLSVCLSLCMSHTSAWRDCDSRGVTAAASRGLAAGQSFSGSASPVQAESGAPLWPKRSLSADGGGGVFGEQPTPVWPSV